MRPRIWAPLVVGVILLGVFLFAQGPGQGQPTGTVVPKKVTPPQDPNSPSQGPKPEVGETVIVPRSTTPPKKQRPQAHKPGEPQGDAPYSIAVSVDLVTFDVAVEDNSGQFIPGLKKANFHLIEDGVPQNLQTFDASEAPMTMVLLVEFNARFQRLYSNIWFQTLNYAYGFVQTSMRKDDWLAIVAYDLKPEIILDFTQNRDQAQGALGRLRFPGFSESCLFDALADTLDRLKDVAGKKGIVLLATGTDSFSRLTYDKAMHRVKEGAVPIYAISLGQVMRIMNESRMSGPAETTFLQADNALKTFASDSGGRAYFPRFDGEMPGVFQNISALMRNQYTMGYVPSNPNKDGKFRKVKIELVDNQGNPLKIVDQKGKEVKVKVVAKSGYYAPKGEVVVN